MEGTKFFINAVTTPFSQFIFDIQRFDLSEIKGAESAFAVVKKETVNNVESDVTYYGTEADFTTENLSGATSITLLNNVTASAAVSVNKIGTGDNAENVQLKLGEFKLTANLTDVDVVGAKFSTQLVTGDSATTTNYYSKDSDFTSEKLTGVTDIQILGDLQLQDAVSVDLGTEKTNVIKVVGNATLDLNGKTFTIDRPNTVKGLMSGSGSGSSANPENSEASAIVVADGSSFTVDDTSSAKNGKINYIWGPTEIKAIKSARTSAAVQVGEKVGTYSDVLSDTPKSVFTMVNGTVESKSVAVSMSDNAVVNVTGGKLTSSESSAIYYGNKSPGGGEINVSGGTLETQATSLLPAIQVSGEVANLNSNFSNIKDHAIPAKITVTGGTITHNGDQSKELITDSSGNATGIPDDCNPNAICASGNTILDISGGTITASGTAIEIRAGSLNITGGDISSTGTKYFSTRKNGGSSYGVAITVAQHSTNQAIDVNISGDKTNITGLNALGVTNPYANEAIGTGDNVVTAKIEGGNFNSTASSSDSSGLTGNAILADKTNVVITVNDGNLNGNVTVNKTEETVGKAKTQEATVALAGGKTTGKVQVLETKTGQTTPTELENNSALQVMGDAQITDVASANKYVAPGYEISSTGKTKESSNNAWSLTGGIAGQNDALYSYVLDGGTKMIPLLTAKTSGSSVGFAYDSANRLFALPDSAQQGGSYSVGSGASMTSTNSFWNNADLKKGYYLIKYATNNNKITVTPTETEINGIKIMGTAGGIIADSITALEVGVADSLGVYVDATDNKLSYMTGAAGKDEFKAGDRDTTLDGGKGNDTLEGGKGKDTFVYMAGADVIKNYEYGTDIVSLKGNGYKVPLDFNNAVYDGTDFKIVLGGTTDSMLTFKSASQVLLNVQKDSEKDDVFYYAKDRIIANNEHIVLGSAFTDKALDVNKIDGYDGISTINATEVKTAVKITGNDSKASTIFGAAGGGELIGGSQNDFIQAMAIKGASSTLRGGDGNDYLVGSSAGYNLFVYSAGADSIKGYNTDVDLVSVVGSEVSFADLDVETKDDSSDLIIKFDDSNKILVDSGIAKPNGVSLAGGRKDTYVVKKDSINLNNEKITLTSGFADSVFSADGLSSLEFIKATAVTGAISIKGNDNGNYILGSEKFANSLAGGSGNDTLVGGDAADVFFHTGGKDVIEGFVGTSDSLSIETDNISKAKASNRKFVLTMGNKNDVITFKTEDALEKVSLTDGGYLTKDGVVGTNNFKLFSNAKGKIDLTGDAYKDASITSIDATKAKNQSVTLVAGAVAESNTLNVTFADKNKKKDGFEFGGGNVSISNYEGGYDKINLGDNTITGFTVTDKDVAISVDGGVISIAGAQGEEVLIHDGNSKGNSYSKMVFKETGVFYNKKKSPTKATIINGVENGFSVDPTIKNITVSSGVAGVSIQAGDKNNTLIDASAASDVSLYGGKKNDKLTGSNTEADTFIYAGGKDVITNYSYSTGDAISFDDTTYDIDAAKITASKKSLKFKFGNGSKNTLTLKGDNIGTSQIKINGTDYAYAKNAVVNGEQVSLTSQFGGTYKIDKDDKTELVDGANVTKSLTLKGTSAAEKLIGGSGKNNFKGGGGADTLVGGSGKDTFFFAKGDKDTVTIENFDFSNDRLKVASGTIKEISQNGSSSILFATASDGKKNSAIDGGLNITSFKDATLDKALIKANNTYYWFEEGEFTDSNGETQSKAWVTSISRISDSTAKGLTSNGYDIINLNYSTNLVKSGVAYKSDDFTVTSSSITKKS